MSDERKKWAVQLRDADAEGRRAGVSHESDGPVQSTPRSEHRPSTRRPLCGHLPQARVRRIMRKIHLPSKPRDRAARMLQAATLGLLRSDTCAAAVPGFGLATMSSNESVVTGRAVDATRADGW
jgi:hypothetical protein